MIDLREQKRQMRLQALAARKAQQDKDGLSRRIMDRLLELPAYQQARTVMLYIGVRSEVSTRQYVPRILASGRRLVVPFCEGDELGLFLLSDLSELQPSGFGLLEPPPVLRAQADRRPHVRDLDLIAVPGLAFDRRGARLGHGKAYYDRLLHRVRRDTVLAGLAFECQMVAEGPTGRRDVFMDWVITEDAVYPGIGRHARSPALLKEPGF